MSDVDFLAALASTFYYLEIARDCPSLRVLHFPRLLVADPCVRTSSSGVHPHYMLEAKILPQRGVDYFYSHGNELPAPHANVGARAARPYLVVISKIYIENQLFRYRAESTGLAQALPIARVCTVDGADFETRGVEAEDVFAEATGCELMSDVYRTRYERTDLHWESFGIEGRHRSAA